MGCVFPQRCSSDCNRTYCGTPSPCGEYGCELMCNDGGCEHVSRVCPVGFRMAETVNGVTCTDIDECEASSCEGTCINTEGGFVCDCGPGMKLSTDRTSCYGENLSLCQQKCKNLQGSYRCLCATGFVLQSNGHTCADINECRRPGTSHLCKHFCHNTHGSFFCSCRAGFLLDPDSQAPRQKPEYWLLNIIYFTEIPAGMQTTGLPWETQAAHGNWMPFQPTSVMPQTSESLTTGGPHPLRTSTELAQDSHCWHNRELHLSGATWAELRCTDCTCQDGNVSCEKRICTPNSSHPVMTYGGRFSGVDGELFPNSPDNCTICICLAGNVTCIPPVCPPVTCTDPFLSDCLKTCSLNSTKHYCFILFSPQNGAVECSFIPCPSLECPRENWVLEAGQCCFKCQEPMQRTGNRSDVWQIKMGQHWYYKFTGNVLSPYIIAPPPESWQLAGIA
uniref:EGF-like domain-containing protein n=1 Tax=Xenopus tropicalis TaxID=8364 RepID=A0A6I8PYS3_XENTR